MRDEQRKKNMMKFGGYMRCWEKETVIVMVIVMVMVMVEEMNMK